FPVGAIGYLAEAAYLVPYRNTRVVTISRSTEQDLRDLGFRGPITIIPIGIRRIATVRAPKADTPTFVYVGRLAPSKRIGDLITALALFRQTNGTGTLWLVGSGPNGHKAWLRNLAIRHKVGNH